MKKNLILLIPQLNHGGAERVVSRLSYILSNHYSVKIVVFDNREITYDVGCEVISLNVPPNPTSTKFLKILNILKRLFRYSKVTKKYKVDLTYSFGNSANIINVLTRGQFKRVISLRGFRRIIQGHSLIEKLVYKPISKMIYSKADKIICVSDLMTETLVELYKLPKNKVFTSYNGYNVKDIQQQGRQALTKDEQTFFSKHDVIIAAGTHRYEKGYWHLIKSFSKVIEKNSNARLIILGKNHLGYKNKMESLIKKLNLTGKVIFLGYQSNPFKYISKSKIYVLSSVFEGFPNSLVESMACGVPVIAADCESGPREIIAPKISLKKNISETTHAEFGVLTPRLNKKENFDSVELEKEEIQLSEAIVNLLNNKTLQEKYKIKSVERAMNFSYNEWGKNQLSILKGVFHENTDNDKDV